MATKIPKDPPFPHPALEVGVPQYPTPNVPDFYTKSGHIILVDKISADKGSYNPQPLDGSVTYSGKDANKFPSPLYLVRETPTPDGLFVYRTWANDRTTSSQDPWNYGISYSSENPSYPIYTREYITPRSQYTPLTIGSTDPVFGGNAIVAKQDMKELGDDNPLRSRYVVVQVVYETIPGPTLSGERLTNRGDLETITTQTVPAGTAPDADGLYITETSVNPVDSVKSTKTTGSVSSYAQLTSNVQKSGLLGITYTHDDIVSPTTLPDDLSLSVIDSSVEAITATKSRKRTTYSTGPTSLISKKINKRGDTETSTESIVEYNQSPTSESYLLQSSQVDYIDSSKSKKTDVLVSQYSSLTGNSFDLRANSGGAVVTTTNQIVDPNTYTTPTPSLGVISYKETPISTKKIEVVTESVTEFPQISSSQIDPITNTSVFNSYKQIVSAGQQASASGGVVNEVEGLDKFHSELISRDYRSLIGASWTEYENESFTYPAYLLVQNASWNLQPGPGNIQSYIRQQSKTITATITYTISDTAESVDCYNIKPQTLITDYGTFSNVIHNVAQYPYNNSIVGAAASVPNTNYMPATIILRYSCTRIPKMGGLYLKKKTEIPFASAFA